MIIRKSSEEDSAAILTVVNAAALAYRGVIPPDRWREPYMAPSDLEEEQRVSGVMGIQDKGEVALIRHAYVLPGVQRKSVGTSWAIAFYQRNGFAVLPDSQRASLLRRYWSIPERQIETSVVLADRRWMEA